MARYIIDSAPRVAPLPTGKAVQVDPINPTLKAPGTNRLKLKYDKLLSILLQFCFQIQLAPLHTGPDFRAAFVVGRRSLKRVETQPVLKPNPC